MDPQQPNSDDISFTDSKEEQIQPRLSLEVPVTNRKRSSNKAKNSQETPEDNQTIQKQQPQLVSSQKINILPFQLPLNPAQKRCCNCRMKSAIYQGSKIILIQLENQEYYCDTCLQEILKEEQQKMKRIQEKYIYQKQFESSGMAHQIIQFSDDTEEKQYKLLLDQVDQLEMQEGQLSEMVLRMKKQCSQLQDRVYTLQRKQQKFWSDINKFEKRALKLQEKGFTAKSQKEFQKSSLEQLSKSSVIHQFFNIQVQDSYAHIYGLIIGKKTDMVEVNWEQTNSGIGHLLLAYNYLSLKYGITYTRIQNIKIKGSLSEILLRNASTYYPIAYSGKDSEKIFGNIMDALLIQLSDLAQTIQEIQNIQYTQQLKLPFLIDKKQAKILDLSLNPTKLDEKSKWTQWTKAMRYFLIDFKHLLTISSLYDPYL